MKNRFPEVHQAILELPLGESLFYSKLDPRTIRQIVGDVTYFFTGHVEVGDERIGQPDCEHVTLNWDWRVTLEYHRNPETSALWDLTITKIPVPDDQSNEIIEAKRVSLKKRV